MAEDQRKKEKMTAFLPDLVTDALLRLPVKSLLRFRCLSASVWAEIDSADFVKNHLNRSIQSKTGQKLIISISEISKFADDLQDTAPLNNPLLESPPHFTHVSSSSCNGLILLGMIFLVKNNTIFNFALWNPFARQYKKLPLHPAQPLPGHKAIVRYGLGYGLGYDSTLDDYKFVMFLDVHNSNHVSFQVWIFGLKSNYWRKSHDLSMVNVKCRSCVGRFANGALYWKCEDYILGFDLAHEVFFEVPVFSDCGQTITFKGHLLVLAGNLYAPVIRDYHNRDYYLLVRDKGGEAAGGSWRKEFTVEEVGYKLHNFDPPLPLAYSKEGDSILVSKQTEIFWYNLENKTREEWLVNKKVSTSNIVVICWESLVSLGSDSVFDGAADKVIIYDLER